MGFPCPKKAAGMISLETSTGSTLRGVVDTPSCRTFSQWRSAHSGRLPNSRLDSFSNNTLSPSGGAGRHLGRQASTP